MQVLSHGGREGSCAPAPAFPAGHGAVGHSRALAGAGRAELPDQFAASRGWPPAGGS